MWPEQGYGVDIEKKVITSEMKRAHQRSLRKLTSNKTWTSHTVAIVDQSGSMRKIDMDTKVMRSDVVWLSLAVEVVHNGLVSGEKTSSDVLSVVAMKTESEIVIYAQPFDWILYNKLVALLRESKPSQGGCYVPAIDAAESLLIQNQSRSCAKTLLFLSDGRPSDEAKPGERNEYESRMIRYSKARIGKLATNFGKRLTVCCVAIGDPKSDQFCVIKAIADEAKDYGCSTIFQKASLSTSALASALTRMTTETTTTMTTVSDETSSESGPKEYRNYKIKSMREVGSGQMAGSETWQSVAQRRRRYGRQQSHVMRTIVRTEWKHKQGWATIPEEGMFHSPDAVGVAFETRWFGEGAERIVKEFREIDRWSNFVGPKLVAKDTKFIDKEKGTKADSKKFHKVFAKPKFELKSWRSCSTRHLQTFQESTTRSQELNFLAVRCT